jgi:hypothetical protein
LAEGRSNDSLSADRNEIRDQSGLTCFLADRSALFKCFRDVMTPGTQFSQLVHKVEEFRFLPETGFLAREADLALLTVANVTYGQYASR